MVCPRCCGAHVGAHRIPVAYRWACLTAEIIAGPRSLAVKVSRDVNSARTIAAGRGMMRDDVGSCRRRTLWPICGSGSWRANAVTSLVDNRAMLDRWPTDPPMARGWRDRGRRWCRVDGAYRSSVRRSDCPLLARCGRPGMEQAVIATQMHAATQAKCLTQQACSDAAGDRCRDRMSEEDPNVSSAPGL